MKRLLEVIIIIIYNFISIYLITIYFISWSNKIEY